MGLTEDKLLNIPDANHKCIHELLNIKKEFHIIAGPCAVESYEQMELAAQALVEQKINIIRAGAYKPRTSPYDFQGLEEEGIHILYEISKEYHLIAASEIVDVRDMDLFDKYIDIIQVGARNMQNFSLLKELGKVKKTIILKRGFSATLRELLCAAEYIISNGNNRIILCERGIRTFETQTRNTLDISSVALIKEITSFPIIVDISHSLGRKDIMLPVSKAVKAVGADGIMIEVHPNPGQALSDRKQQLDFNEFANIVNELK